MKKQWVVYLIFLFNLSGCGFIDAPNYDGRNYDAKVMEGYSGQKPNIFSDVQDALDAAPADATKPYRIFIAEGNYYEKLIINKPNIHLFGAGMDKTRLFYDAYSGQEYEAGKTWGTRGSGSIIVRAAGVEFHQLTIENSFDFLANDQLAADDPKKIRDAQAVALYLDQGSDRVVVRQVKLLGYQDTLFVNAGRSWFDQTKIAGNIDYIFGAGNALFTDSEIITRVRSAKNYPHGYVTAPSTQITSEFGLTFIRCRLTREAGVPDNSTALGRPWHPTTDFADGRYADPNAIGKTVFIKTEMDAHITREGWDSMGGTAREGGKRLFMPEDARFFEFKNTGKGAEINPHRRQLAPDKADDYTVEKILGEWVLTR